MMQVQGCCKGRKGPTSKLGANKLNGPPGLPRRA